tara:strand:- start:1289 stop:1459 length:171 start_codon:yes stop_codon:yes gene_type:complete
MYSLNVLSIPDVKLIVDDDDAVCLDINFIDPPASPVSNPLALLLNFNALLATGVTI